MQVLAFIFFLFLRPLVINQTRIICFYFLSPLTVLYETVAFLLYLLYHMGHFVASRLRHCATNQKVTGLIPDGVGIFH